MQIAFLALYVAWPMLIPGLAVPALAPAGALLASAFLLALIVRHRDVPTGQVPPLDVFLAQICLGILLVVPVGAMWSAMPGVLEPRLHVPHLFAALVGAGCAVAAGAVLVVALSKIPAPQGHN